MKSLWRLLRVVGRPFAYVGIWLLRCPYEAANTALLAAFLRDCLQAVGALDSGCLYAAVGRYSFLLLALYAFNGCAWSANAAYTAFFGASLREQCFAYLAECDPARVEARSRADWITRLNSDTTRAMGMLSEPMQAVFLGCGAVSLAVSSLLMGKADMAMLGLVLLCTAPHILISQVFLAGPMRALNADMQRETAEASSRLGDLIDCALPARAYGAEEWMLKRFEEKSEALRRAAMRVRMRSALGKGLMLTMGMGGYLAAMALGASAIAADKYDLGALVGLFQLRGGIMGGAMMLAASALGLRGSAASADRLLDMLNGK